MGSAASDKSERRAGDEAGQNTEGISGPETVLWIAAFLALLVFAAVVLCFQLLDDDVERWLETFKDQPVAVPLLAGLYLFKAVTVIIVPQPLTYLLTGCCFPGTGFSPDAGLFVR